MRGARVLHEMASGSCPRAYGTHGRQRKIIHACASLQVACKRRASPSGATAFLDAAPRAMLTSYAALAIGGGAVKYIRTTKM
ncbi:hypothetical protein WS62_31465 [Burkholderia sp. ABCPW 14]|nr:hypothetical protein WS62_31465 [Burkholderia sp. ABCPW 14]